MCAVPFLRLCRRHNHFCDKTVIYTDTKNVDENRLVFFLKYDILVMYVIPERKEKLTRESIQYNSSMYAGRKLYGGYFR